MGAVVPYWGEIGMLAEDIIVLGGSGAYPLYEREKDSRVDRGETRCRLRPGVEVTYWSRIDAVDVGDS